MTTLFHPRAKSGEAWNEALRHAMGASIDTAMVLAAGLGKRMRPLTDTMPKPMVPLHDRPLIDHTLDRLAASGISRAVVNVHYLADVLEAHLAKRQEQQRGPDITVSDERGLLLETGGGVVKALPLIDSDPFLICNSDTTWAEAKTRNLDRLISAWDGTQMDALLLLAHRSQSLGYSGHGDFQRSADGRLRRRMPEEETDLVFAGVSIASAAMFEGAPADAFSLNVLWDRAIEKGRVFGVALDGWWMHVGTPEALAEAGQFLARQERGEIGTGRE